MSFMAVYGFSWNSIAEVVEAASDSMCNKPWTERERVI